jgi:hypothetical protein
MKALAAFDHGHDSLCLAAVVVGFVVETYLHESPIVTTGGLGGRPANFGRNDRSDTAVLAGEAVIAFRVVSRVGTQAPQMHPTLGLLDQGHKLIDVRPGSTTGAQCENEMAACVAHQA